MISVIKVCNNLHQYSDPLLFSPSPLSLRSGGHFGRLTDSDVQETCTELRSDAVIRELRSHIAQLRKAKPPTFMVKKVEAVPWNPTPKLVDLGEM